MILKSGVLTPWSRFPIFYFFTLKLLDSVVRYHPARVKGSILRGPNQDIDQSIKLRIDRKNVL
jgi:hypothetical protein